MLAVLGGLADVERDLIRARTAEGRSRAKARGQPMGRPSYDRSISTMRRAWREPNRPCYYRLHQHALKTRSGIIISHCNLFLLLA
jgi:DNA invertase Pin-like site-specific DNA recombinase